MQKGSVCARGEKGRGSQALYTEKIVRGFRGGLLDSLEFRAAVEFGAAVGFRAEVLFGSVARFGTAVGFGGAAGFGAAVGFGGASGNSVCPSPIGTGPLYAHHAQLHPHSFTTKPSRTLNCGSDA